MDDDLDPTALLSPLRAGLKLVRVLQRWNEGPERASIYQDHYEEWVADLAARLRENVARDIELAERLDALEQDRERVLVLGNLGFEAWREAVDRRRVMLGDAAEATIFSELSAAELARVERTVRMLDPEDLVLLGGLAQIQDTFRHQVTPEELAAAQRAGHPTQEPEYLYEQLVHGHLEGAVLTAAGCVRVEPRVVAVLGGATNIRLGARVTPLGELVLRFMGRSA